MGIRGGCRGSGVRARRASPHYQFLGHRAHGGGDAEQVGGGGPGGDVEGGLQARCREVGDAVAVGVVGLDARQPEARQHRGSLHRRDLSLIFTPYYFIPITFGVKYITGGT